MIYGGQYFTICEFALFEADMLNIPYTFLGTYLTKRVKS
jgi:hypothetical protein